jgi:hypothetical protein
VIEQALYSVETNLVFDKKEAKVEHVPEAVLAAFQIPVPLHVKCIEKHNLFSRIYVCQSEIGEVVFRSTSASEKKLLEKQCEVFSSLSKGVVLNPLKNSNGTFVTINCELAWTAYPYVDGNLYGGEPDEALNAFEHCLQVAYQLKSTGEHLSGREANIFPQVSLDPVSWGNALNHLMHDLAKPLLEALGEDLHEFLVSQEEKLVRLIQDLYSRQLSPTSLVHYDLQHANIVMSKPKPTVIDLEDVYFAPFEVALCHCAFKLARHVVFVDAVHKPWVISKLVPAMTAKLMPVGIRSNAELFEYSAIRTLNDIAYIFHLYNDKGKDFVLYDLRKKVLNLLEAADLTGCHDRVGLG